MIKQGKEDEWSGYGKKRSIQDISEKGFEKEYEWRYRNIWTEVKAKIEASGVYDYSIFLDENTGDAFCCAEVQGD